MMACVTCHVPVTRAFYACHIASVKRLPAHARLHGIQPSLLFKWKKQYQEGSLTAVAAGEEVVPASELTAALKQVRELQRLLGKKTMEVEILKEAVEYGQSRKWIAHAPLLPKDGE